MYKCPYPSPSSVGDFQRRVIGKGTTSVMENSRTLNAGDKIAHYTQTHKQITTLHFMNHRIFVQDFKTWRHYPLASRGERHLKCTASGDSFVCVERGADVFAEELADSLFDGGASRRASHYLYCIDVVPAQLCHRTHTMHLVDFIVFKQYTLISSTTFEGHTWLFKRCLQWHLHSHQILSTHFFKMAPVGYKWRKNIYYTRFPLWRCMVEE